MKRDIVRRRLPVGLRRVSGLALLAGSVLACASNGPAPSTPGAGQSVASASDSPPDLAPPEGLRAHSGVLRAVPLKWEPVLVGDVGGYAIERASARGGPFVRIATVPGRVATEWIDRGEAASKDAGAADAPLGLLDGVTRYYRVRAYAPAGEFSAASEVVAATTAPLPAPPEDLRAYSHQPRQVPLSWAASPNPTVAGYVVYRSPTAGGPFEELARIAERFQTTWVDRDLGDLRVFYYAVSALNAAGGEGALSELVRGVTKPEPLPPFEVRVVEQRLGVNRLAWAPNVETDIIEYRVRRRRSGADALDDVAVLPSDRTEARDGSVLADERVDYSVIAVDRDGLESAPSAPLPILSEGYGLTATVKRDGIHLHFDIRMDEGYRRASIRRRGVLGYSDIGVSYDGRFVDPDVEPGGRYEYTATLQRTDGTNGPTSSPVAIEVPAR